MSSKQESVTKIVWLLMIIFLSIIILPTYTVGGGRTGCSFLKIATGGRCVGMGEVGAAVSDDVNSANWNPAGLTLINEPELSFMHNEWLQSINYDYLSYAQPLEKKNGVIAISFYSITMDRIDGYDDNDEPTDGVEASDSAWAISYAREIKTWSRKQINLSGGVNLKFIQEDLDDKTGKATAVDAGILCRLPVSCLYCSTVSSSTKKGNPRAPMLGMGISVQNIGNGIEFFEEKAPLPRNIKLGISLSALDNLLIAGLDYNIPYLENPRLNLGLEYKYCNMLTIRSGYVFGLDVSGGLRAGAGLKYKRFQLDYAFAPYGDLGYSHRINLKIKFFNIIPDTSS